MDTIQILRDLVIIIVSAKFFLYIYPDGKQQPKYGDRLPEGKYSAREYWNEWYFSTNTEMIRSSAIRDFDHDLLENNYNDNVITFLGIQRGSIYYIPKLMASYVQTGKGLWTGENFQRFICFANWHV
jgi:hypothetical protein